jgi:hypothetical protein
MTNDKRRVHDLDQELALKYAQMQEQFRRGRELRGTFLDQAINIERELEGVLCDLFRIDYDHREIFRRNLLAAPPPTKIDTLQQMLEEIELNSGRFRSLPNRLRRMNNRRVMFAHAHVVIDRSTDEVRYTFEMSRQGRVRTETVDATEIERWLAEQTRVYGDLLRLVDEVRKSRAGTVYLNAISLDGNRELTDTVVLPPTGDTSSLLHPFFHH